MELIWIGPSKPEVLRNTIEIYQERIAKYTELNITLLKNIKGIEDGARLTAEEEKLIKKQIINKNRYVVLLDEKGKQFTSREFASWLETKRMNTRGEITFVFGGSFGFSETFKADADEILSFSKMTFSHQIIRLVFMEQLYRAFTILNNQPYHND
ncbi:MAG: 23S rRNA (pseudouridine(1915)-N(3))-methyltransferase RlmH [Saprospiraceae bacterium]|nr:23S rRNA (pseudouridine(1915)-N(3))-methyltransferase RlmH [Saprospiraceae bacterium]